MKTTKYLIIAVSLDYDLISDVEFITEFDTEELAKNFLADKDDERRGHHIRINNYLDERYLFLCDWLDKNIDRMLGHRTIEQINDLKTWVKACNSIDFTAYETLLAAIRRCDWSSNIKIEYKLCPVYGQDMPSINPILNKRLYIVKAKI